MTCNGWTNSETWTVNLWFGDVFAEMADEGALEGDMLKDFVIEMLESDGSLPESGLVADVMNEFLRKVDWDELAANHTVEEEEEELA